MILSALLLGLTPTVFLQEPEETELEVAQRKVAELEAELGPEHPDVAVSLNNLASLLDDQGSYAEARPLYERSLAILEKVHGPEHPDVATSLNNLAYLLDAQGSYAEARPLYERSLAIREKSLGPEHPDVALSLNNLANLLDAQGSYAEARPLYEQNLRVKLNHLSMNMGSMTEAERFRYLDIQTGPEFLFLTLVAMQGNGPTEE